MLNASDGIYINLILGSIDIIYNYFYHFCRAHLNDLENILPFLVLGLLFIGTGPSLNWVRDYLFLKL